MKMAKPAYVIVGNLVDFVDDLKKSAYETAGNRDDCRDIIHRIEDYTTFPAGIREALKSYVDDIYREEREKYEDEAA